MMTPESRRAILFAKIYEAPDAILRRYTAPEHLAPDRQRDEIMFIVDDLEAMIPDGTEQALLAIIRMMHAKLRGSVRGRTWPTVADFTKAAKDAIASHIETNAEKGNIESLTIEQRKVLDKVLETARRWLDIPGLAQHGRKTLDHWQQEAPKGAAE